MSCFILGDSIAVGLALANPTCASSAAVGLSSAAIARRHVIDATHTVISAGSNDPRNPRLVTNLRTIRSKIGSRTTWIVPANRHAAAAVRRAARPADQLVYFKTAADGVHPRSYRTLKRSVKWD